MKKPPGHASPSLDPVPSSQSTCDVPTSTRPCDPSRTSSRPIAPPKTFQAISSKCAPGQGRETPRRPGQESDIGRASTAWQGACTPHGCTAERRPAVRLSSHGVQPCLQAPTRNPPAYLVAPSGGTPPSVSGTTGHVQPVRCAPDHKSSPVESRWPADCSQSPGLPGHELSRAGDPPPTGLEREPRARHGSPRTGMHTQRGMQRSEGE